MDTAEFVGTEIAAVPAYTEAGLAVAAERFRVVVLHVEEDIDIAGVADSILPLVRELSATVLDPAGVARRHPHSSMQPQDPMRAEMLIRLVTAGMIAVEMRIVEEHRRTDLLADELASVERGRLKLAYTSNSAFLSWSRM